MEINKIYNGDCLELMTEISDRSINLILCDLPYEVTARQKWDVIIPFDKLWSRYNRIISDNGAIVLFATEPFRTQLIYSNIKNFKYDLIWQKNKSTGFLNAKKMPLRNHESLLVFYKNPPTYNPQKSKGAPRKAGFKRNKNNNTLIYGDVEESSYIYTEERYPTSILDFPVVNNDSSERIHTAQKPTELLEYIIKTYTNENDLVLDNCIGSGSTAIAAINTNRNWIGIEKDETFFDNARKRIENRLNSVIATNQ